MNPFTKYFSTSMLTCGMVTHTNTKLEPLKSCLFLVIVFIYHYPINSTTTTYILVEGLGILTDNFKGTFSSLIP